MRERECLRERERQRVRERERERDWGRERERNIDEKDKKKYKCVSMLETVRDRQMYIGKEQNNKIKN